MTNQGVAASSNQDRIRVVLDCDTANEVDDQFAIAHALGSPQLDVVGVVSVQNTLVHGSASVARYQEEARTITRLCGRPDVPCPQGAAAPMEDIHTPVPSDGLEFLIEAAREAPYTLLATGPATDVASLLLAAPELRDRVTIIWAGAFPDEATWQQHKFGELNARADIQSWRALFSLPCGLRVLPGWPGVEKVAIPAGTTVERLQALGSPLTAYLADLLEAYVAARDGKLDMDDKGRGLKVLWDVVNVAALTVPDAVMWTSHVLPTVDPAGWPDWSRRGRAVPWGLDVDADAVLDDLWRALSHHAAAEAGPECGCDDGGE